ncbi:MAG: PDZ domain-containing protein [Desulfobacterales bacterium]
MGIEISNITREIQEQFNLGSADGVIVVNVAPDSKGAKAGIAKGDVIKEINHQPVKDVDDYKAIVKKVDDGESLYFYIKRMNKGFMVIKVIK